MEVLHKLQTPSGQLSFSEPVQKKPTPASIETPIGQHPAGSNKMIFRRIRQ